MVPMYAKQNNPPPPPPKKKKKNELEAPRASDLSRGDPTKPRFASSRPWGLVVAKPRSGRLIWDGDHDSDAVAVVLMRLKGCSAFRV